MRRTTPPILAFALLLASPAAAVGDLELLQATHIPPNVMILLDNSQSMDAALESSTRTEIARDAVLDMIEVVYPDDGAGGYDATVRLGLAIFDTSGADNGADIMVPIADNNKAAMIAEVQDTAVEVLANNGTFTPLSEALVDVGRYFAGTHGFGEYADFANTSPMDYECRQNFVMIVTDGQPTNDRHDHADDGDDVVNTSANSYYVNLIGNADGDSSECAANVTACMDAPRTGRDDGFDYSNNGTDWLDDVAYYLFHNDLVPDVAVDGVQNIKTYTIGFTLDIDLLAETATNGGGQYYTANNSTELADSLTSTFTNIFDSIQASFTSAVVPGAQIGLGNAFYNSFFVSSDDPVWEGHLEALRISQTGEIQDSNLDPAVDSVTGELLDTRDPFWDAATPLKTNTSRTIYTTKAGARVTFDSTNVTSTELALGAPVYAEYPAAATSGIDSVGELVTAIIAYVRGQDGFDEDDDNDYSEMREVVFGDIFHSTPRAIAQPTRFHLTQEGYPGFFTAYYERDRVVYAGANDGLLHAFAAGSHSFGDDASTPELELQYYSAGNGAELFGYVPGVQLSRMQLLPRNSPRTAFFVDGPISVADAWLSDGTGSDVTKTTDEWATVMITGMREGGTGYLALDITDPGATAGDDHYPYPSLLWEFTDADLGDSWSEPVVTRVKVENTSGTGDNCGPDDSDGDCREQWVAIFAGGYEADGDPNRPTTYVADPANVAWQDKSKAIYMVSLHSGAVLAKVKYDSVAAPDMKFSIPSAPAVIDVNFDGFADVVYVGDLGGQMWKWDISAVGQDGSSPADGTIDNWPAGVFFRTDPVTVGANSHYRSFFYPPVASFSNSVLTLAFGSGERHDLGYEGDGSADDENRFYVVKDYEVIGADAFDLTYEDDDLTDVTALDTDNVLTDAGYFFTLAESEKFVTEVTVFAGYVIVGSYTPDSSSDLCATAGGQSFLHVFNLATGSGFFPDAAEPPSEDRRSYIGGGFPTSPEVTVATDPDDDVIIVKTSEGPKLITIDAPPRTEQKGQIIYWKQQL
jgi:type IV pilus assembly protein PilY1